MPFLNREIADALCTVITLGFAIQKEANGDPLVFEYENRRNNEDVKAHELIQDAFGNLGVTIFVRESIPQNLRPYILGHNLPPESLRTFIAGLDAYYLEKERMFEEANRQNPPPRGAYIGVQFFVDSTGKILERKTDDPLVYGPSALSLHPPLFREIIPCCEGQEIAIAYYKARKSTNDAAVAVSNGLLQAIGGNYDVDYIRGHLFGSNHGMIRAMVNSVEPPKDIQSVFAEIALGAGTTKVSSCIPCAIFMQSFGYPASSIHLGRGDNWRIPDSPGKKIRGDWKNAIIGCYLSGVTLCNPEIDSYGNENLDNVVTKLIAERDDEQDITPHIPGMFLEALTFEGSFMDRIRNTLFP